MIAVHLQGGLGNQLFQYAFGRHLAAARGTELVIDPYWFDHPRRGETMRALELRKLRSSVTVADAVTQRRWASLRSRFAHRLPGVLLPLSLVREMPGGWNAAAMRAGDQSYLRGFWQSEKYFSDIGESLLDDFTPADEPSLESRGLLDLMADGTSVSLHVRRGDYVSLASAAGYHGTCSLNYYGRAIRHLLDLHEGLRFFVFSDDPKWTAENLTIPAKTNFVTHNGPEDAVHDLHLMTHCRHHIIANSSFSWWGAWLAEKRTGDVSVIAPQRWFVERDAPDLVPDRWVRI